MRLTRIAAAVALGAAALTAVPAQAGRPLAIADVSTPTHQGFQHIGGEFTETVAVPSNAVPRVVVISNLSTDSAPTAMHTYTLERRAINQPYAAFVPYVYPVASGVNVDTFHRFELPRGGSLSVPHQPGFTYLLSKLNPSGGVVLATTYRVLDNALV